MKKVTKEKKAEEKVKKVRNLKNNRRRGNLFETTIAKELRELGFEGVVTSRSESKAMDDKKVDLIDKNDQLPCNIQLKRTIKCPDYFAIKKEADQSKPFCLLWNKQQPTTSTFRSVGEVVFVDKMFFYELIKKYANV